MPKFVIEREISGAGALSPEQSQAISKHHAGVTEISAADPVGCSTRAGDQQCDAKMYHMKTASIRDLRYDFKKIEHLLSQGEEVQITKRRKVIARLVPEKPPERPPMPDFMARLKAIYGDRVVDLTGADLLREDRDSRY